MERPERATGAAHGPTRPRPMATAPRPEPTHRRASPRHCSSRPRCCPSPPRSTDEPTAIRTTARPPGPAAAIADGAASEDTAHQNPFLAPEAGGGSAASSWRFAGRRSIAALLTRAIGAANERRQMAGTPLRLVSVTPIRRLLTVRSIRMLAGLLAAAAAIGLTVVILTGSNTAVSPSTRASLHGANVGSLDGRKSAPLAAAASPFAATHATPRSTPAHPRQVQRHQTRNKRPNRRHATGATQPGSGTAALAASYTPPPTTSAGTTSSSDTSGNASSSSSAPAAQPAAQPPHGAQHASLRFVWSARSRLISKWLTPATREGRDMTRILTHARSNLIALIALFVALGGTSYAAINLPAGSVGARQYRTARSRRSNSTRERSTDRCECGRGSAPPAR
jgi:hypothetical protein